MSPNFRIVNVVASTRIYGEIDVEIATGRLSNIQYEPGTFPGLIYRKKNHPTIIMFSSGKISSTGARDENQAKDAIIHTINELEQVGAIVGSAKTHRITIENIVGTANLNRTIDLDAVTRSIKSSLYEPEHFPGLILRIHASIVCLLFSSGKLIIVGAKTKHSAYRAFNEVIGILTGIKN